MVAALDSGIERMLQVTSAFSSFLLHASCDYTLYVYVYDPIFFHFFFFLPSSSFNGEHLLVGWFWGDSTIIFKGTMIILNTFHVWYLYLYWISRIEHSQNFLIRIKSKNSSNFLKFFFKFSNFQIIKILFCFKESEWKIKNGNKRFFIFLFCKNGKLFDHWTKIMNFRYYKRKDRGKKLLFELLIEHFFSFYL